MTEQISNDDGNDILLRLRQDFLEDVVDRLDRMEDALFPSTGNPSDDSSAVLQVLRRECHNIKGMGSSFGFPIVTTIAHRLEDYLATIAGFTDRHAIDIDTYLGHLRAIVERGHDPAEKAAGKIIRSLPINAGFDVADVKQRDVEVLLIAPSRTIAHMVSRELAACGYRVTTARTPWEAFELCICMRPDIVIASATLERVSGIDLLRMFAAISTTADIHRAVLTSFSRNHPSLNALPENTHIVRLKGDVAADLANLITEFEGQPS